MAMAVKSKWIVIISTPRSGTTQACYLLEAHRGTKNFYEPFNRGHPSYLQARMLRALRKRTGLALTSHTDTELGDWVKAHPKEMLETLAGSVPGLRYGCFKLFVNELSDAEFKETLIDRDDTSFLFIKRSPIDSYISLRKAVQAGVWLKSDTTSKRIEITGDGFLEWHQKQSLWLGKMREIVVESGRPFAEMNYEDDFLGGEQKTLSRLYAALAEMGISLELSASTKVRMLLRDVQDKVRKTLGMPPKAGGAVGLTKQDLAPNRSAKVSNWDEFTADLAKVPNGLEMLEDYHVGHTVIRSAK